MRRSRSVARPSIIVSAKKTYTAHLRYPENERRRGDERWPLLPRSQMEGPNRIYVVVQVRAGANEVESIHPTPWQCSWEALLRTRKPSSFATRIDINPRMVARRAVLESSRDKARSSPDTEEDHTGTKGSPRLNGDKTGTRVVGCYPKIFTFFC